jgi:hypothetical protein
MQITVEQAKELMVKVGLFGKDVVGAWKPERLAEKINKLPRLVDKIPKGLAADLLKLYKKVAAAVEAGDAITLGADKPAKGKPAAAPPKGKPAKGKAKPAADEDDEDEDEDEDEESDDDSDDDSDDSDDADDDSDDDSDDSDDADDDEDSEDDEEDADDDADDEDGDDDADDDSDDEEDSDEDDEDSDDGDDEDDADGDDDTDDDSDEDEDEESDDDEEDDDVDEKPKKKAAGKKDAKGSGKGAVKSAGKDGKPGIIESILEFVKAGTKEKGVKKDAIHDKLVKRFKDRNSESMWTTVNLQVPNKLRTDKGVNIQKADNGGYYIAAGKAKAATKVKAKEEPPTKKKARSKPRPAAGTPGALRPRGFSRFTPWDTDTPN